MNVQDGLWNSSDKYPFVPHFCGSVSRSRMAVVRGTEEEHRGYTDLKKSLTKQGSGMKKSLFFSAIIILSLLTHNIAIGGDHIKVGFIDNSKISYDIVKQPVIPNPKEKS